VPGECRRRAPVVLIEYSLERNEYNGDYYLDHCVLTTWPDTLAENGCGEGSRINK
jgi:hypothetical protein